MNFIQNYLDYRANTEPSLFYHRWCCITALGAWLGRSIYFPFGDGAIYPNLYVMLIGNPGARKSTAIRQIKRLLATAGYKTYAAEKTTKEKFLLDLEGIQEQTQEPRNGKDVLKELFKSGMENDSEDDSYLLLQPPREIFIAIDEFNDFTSAGNMEFFSLLGNLWDYEGVFRNRIKHGRSVAIVNPTISILSGNTHTSFAECFPAQSIGQGFLSRIILVYGEATGKKITFPKKPHRELTEDIIKQLREIKEKVKGEALITIESSHALDMIYKSWVDLEDGRFKHYSTRRFTHLLKLCLICMASRASTSVEIQDIVFANTILTYTEQLMPKALGEFGKSKHAEAAGKIMSALYETSKPLDLHALWKIVSNDLDKVADLGNLLTNLQQADKIQAVGKGGFLAKLKSVDSRKLYVDFKLLREMEH